MLDWRAAVAAQEIRAYISMVSEDHTVVVPPELLVGTTVTVTAIPSTTGDEATRRARFDATLRAIREATLYHPQAVLNDDQINGLIEQARKKNSGRHSLCS
jgi:hypothetical protein